MNFDLNKLRNGQLDKGKYNLGSGVYCRVNKEGATHGRIYARFFLVHPKSVAKSIN